MQPAIQAESSKARRYFMTKQEFLRYVQRFPVSAAVKSESEMQMALESDAQIIFILKGDAFQLGPYTERVHAAGKCIVVHVDLIGGIRQRPCWYPISSPGRDRWHHYQSFTTGVCWPCRRTLNYPASLVDRRFGSGVGHAYHSSRSSRFCRSSPRHHFSDHRPHSAKAPTRAVYYWWFYS